LVVCRIFSPPPAQGPGWAAGGTIRLPGFQAHASRQQTKSTTVNKSPACNPSRHSPQPVRTNNVRTSDQVGAQPQWRLNAQKAGGPG